jgi:hypothetical protein
MGVDVNLYALGEVTDEQLTAANEYAKTRTSAWDSWGDQDQPFTRSTVWLGSDDTETPCIQLSTMSRFYGPGYERGDWPGIYSAIRVMRAAFPHCRVFYGGDTDDWAPEATDDYLAAIWDHFLSPAGRDYYDRQRAFQAALEERFPR